MHSFDENNLTVYSSWYPFSFSLGYSGIMKKRTQEYFDEGEATFWKNSRFALVKSETSSLATLANKVLIFKVNVKQGKSGKAFTNYTEVIMAC